MVGHIISTEPENHILRLHQWQTIRTRNKSRIFHKQHCHWQSHRHFRIPATSYKKNWFDLRFDVADDLETVRSRKIILGLFLHANCSLPSKVHVHTILRVSSSWSLLIVFLHNSCNKYVRVCSFSAWCVISTDFFVMFCYIALAVLVAHDNYKTGSAGHMITTERGSYLGLLPGSWK